MVEEERNETLYKAVGSLPEIQRRRFLLYYEYEFNFYQIAAMEHCTASAIQKSVAIAKEKVKAEIEEISPTVTDTARKRNLFFICVGLAALHTLTFFRGSKSIFKEVNAYVQRKQRHRPKGGKPCRSYRQSTPKRSFMNRLRSRPLWWTALSPQACPHYSSVFTVPPSASICCSALVAFWVPGNLSMISWNTEIALSVSPLSRYACAR